MKTLITLILVVALADGFGQTVMIKQYLQSMKIFIKNCLRVFGLNLTN
jgi:hypothetical protein